MTLLDAVARLATAALLSGLVGFEREAAQKAAGLRTHMLVGLGAGLFGILSIEGFVTPGDPTITDTSRIAAQVVTGIGFLGAGAIFREGPLVRGLTTAAGLWTVAAIGLAAGAGMFAVAAAATAVVLVVLFGLRTVDRIVKSRIEQRMVGFEVVLEDVTNLGDILDLANRLTDRPITQVRYQPIESGGAMVNFQVEPDYVNELVAVLSPIEGVRSVGSIE